MKRNYVLCSRISVIANLRTTAAVIAVGVLLVSAGQSVPMSTASGNKEQMQAAHSAQFSNRPVLPAADPADNLWAKALFVSLTEYEMPEKEIEALFFDVLRSTANKAPIYVSLGDYYSGAMPFGRVGKEMTAKNQGDVAERIVEKVKEVHPEQTGKLTDAETTEVVGSLSNILWTSLLKDVTETLDQMSNVQSRALTFYQTAAAECPDSPLAWSRIAMGSDSDERLRTRAISQFIRTDPDNALPYFLLAMEECKSTNVVSALKSVAAGNSAKICRLYDSPLPAEFQLIFPDKEPYKSSGVSGKPVPVATLHAMSESAYAWKQLLLHADFRRLARDLNDKGEEFLKAGNNAAAMEYFEAVVRMGLHLVRGQSCPMITVLNGLAVAQMPLDNLEKPYTTERRTAEKARLARLRNSLRTFYKECRSIVQQYSTWDDDTGSSRLYRGEYDPAKERVAVQVALKKCGISDVSLDAP